VGGDAKMRFRFLLAAPLLAFPASQIAAETSRLAFVTEYVRELGINEDMRERAQKDVADAGADKNVAIIRSGTRIILELNSQIEILKDMTLNPPFNGVPGGIAEFYKYKVKAYHNLINMATAFVLGPKPDVDYGAIAAEAPKETATLEHIDRSLFKITPLIFATLISDKPDSQGHMSVLRITRAERDHLLQTLQIDFGDKMNGPDQNYIVSSAAVLRDYLSKKGYKCSDDPL
jgi:hypothetical protein